MGSTKSSTAATGTWLAPLEQVTSVSKVLAAVLFVVLPFVGFYLGYEAGTAKGLKYGYSQIEMPPQSVDNEQMPPVGEDGTATGKLKADTFTGTLDEVNTGCFADGECYVVVDGKHVTVLMGWSQETVGSIVGAESIGDLEALIGQTVEVYAQDLTATNEGYTLYGSDGFYVKVLP